MASRRSLAGWLTGGMVLGLLAAPAAAGAQDSSVRLRLGLFTPDPSSGDGYFAEAERDFRGGDAEALEDAVGGIDFRHDFGGRVGVLLSADLFEGQADRSYRRFVDNRGNEIEHTATLEVASFTAGVVIDLAPHRAPLIPYIGAGGGAYTYRLEESGDFIDFTTPGRQIFTTTNEAEGSVLGYYLLAGLELPIGPYFSLFAEGRWDRADEELGDDFEGLGTLDLSGRRVMGGLAWRF